jgi:glycosyltransferase involved in cell wall biosynthesis
MIPELFPNYYSYRNPQIIMKRKLIPLARRIIAVSEQTKKDIINIFNIPENKISVVYHGADTTPYYPSVGIKFDFEYLLYIGERHMYKNFISFCRSCMPILRRHKELKVVCTGKPFSSEEIFFFEAFGMKERFIHFFPETHQEILDLYHNAIAFAYPSSYEGFGIPILEAYTADCPVMLNRASCFPEIAGDAALYFTMGKESSDFEDVFETLYHLDSNEREQLLQKQRERLKLYSWKKSAEKLANAYQNL